MNEPSKQPIDPRKLAANAKVVVSPAPNQGKKVTLPAGKLQGLSTLPKPTDNPPPKPETIQGPIPNPEFGKDNPAIVNALINNIPPQSEVLKKDSNSVQDIKESKETNDVVKNLGEYAIKGGPGRPKKEHTIAHKAESILQKQHGRYADGTTVTKAEQIAIAMIEKAINGDVKAAQFVSDITDGKPMQKIQVVAPEDAEGTVLSAEAEAKLEAMFGRGK